ncbi:MAG: DUF2868 domain-containing protein [Betaproteobacteria bacterium]
MDERSALQIAAVRALEEADRARTTWTDDDRAWASRAAAQIVGEHAAPSAFIARRATLALERIATRSNALPRTVQAWLWRPWVGVAIVIAAFALGVAADHIGSAQRINVLAPPILVLVVWNLAVYAALGAGYIVHYGDAAPPGPLRRAVVRMAATRGGTRRPREGDADPVPRALVALAHDWIAIAAPLYAMRATRILHLAAAALAAGVLIGMYARGIAFEYRATWESTFLDASFVRTLLTVFYAPGVWLTGTAVPDVAQIDAMRWPGSTNAASWMHLMAATLMLVVILPRLLLALATGLLERHRAARLPIALDQPYFVRLLRGLHDAPVPVRVMPYSFTPDPAAQSTLTALLARAVGGNADVELTPTVAYGAEAAPLPSPPSTWTVALFSLAATPESETHGAFLTALNAHASSNAPLLVLVDEAGLRARLGDDITRLEARRALWRALCSDHHGTPLFIDLVAPDLDAAERELDAALTPMSRPLA